MTDQERIMAHFNQHAQCKRRKDGKPRVQYEPGCTYIECEHERCSCRMNDGDGGPLSDFLARWQQRHGQ